MCEDRGFDNRENFRFGFGIMRGLMESINEYWILFISMLDKIKKNSNGIEDLYPTCDDKSQSLRTSLTKVFLHLNFQYRRCHVR